MNDVLVSWQNQPYVPHQGAKRIMSCHVKYKEPRITKQAVLLLPVLPLFYANHALPPNSRLRFQIQ